MTQVERLIAEHNSEIEAIKTALATNFDAPAQRIINAGFSRMGIDRFDASGDVWEQIVCHQNGWEYEIPSDETMQRWATY